MKKNIKHDKNIYFNLSPTNSISPGLYIYFISFLLFSIISFMTTLLVLLLNIIYGIKVKSSGIENNIFVNITFLNNNVPSY